MLRKNSTKELKNQLEFSERKRIQLQKMLARKTVEEEVPLWSMVDLMTLLLVFFLFLHSLSAKETYLSVNNPKTDRSSLEIKTPPLLNSPWKMNLLWRPIRPDPNLFLPHTKTQA